MLKEAGFRAGGLKEVDIEDEMSGLPVDREEDRAASSKSKAPSMVTYKYKPESYFKGDWTVPSAQDRVFFMKKQHASNVLGRLERKVTDYLSSRMKEMSPENPVFQIDMDIQRLFNRAVAVRAQEVQWTKGLAVQNIMAPLQPPGELDTWEGCTKEIQKLERILALGTTVLGMSGLIKEMGVLNSQVAVLKGI